MGDTAILLASFMLDSLCILFLQNIIKSLRKLASHTTPSEITMLPDPELVKLSTSLVPL